MNPLSPFFAITIYSIAILTAYLLSLKYKIHDNTTRFENIDGLRGFLALGVFIHHSSVWYHFLHTNDWKSPNSNLYNQLGQASVSLFFMITAFLFISKLLNSDAKKINWKTLYISRFFRIVPLYLATIILLVFIVFVISNWELKVSVLHFLAELSAWISFTIIDTMSINAYPDTVIVNAGVVWSLTYEWLFYFSLPLISLFILKERPSWPYLIIGAAFVIGFYLLNSLSPHYLLSFLGGAITPFIIKYGPKNIKYNSIIFSVVILVCFAFMLTFRTSSNYICKIFIIIAFNLIALGNDLFGILKSRALKFLGEICYSTYLIHGIIIFTCMYFVYGFDNARNLSALNYCFTIFALTPILVIVSFLSYTYIEKPFMGYSKKIINRTNINQRDLAEKNL